MGKIQADLKESEEQMRVEGRITSRQLRKNLGV